MNKPVGELKPEAEVIAEPLMKLREKFPDHQIGKLPKPTKQQTDEVKADFKKGKRCTVCHSWHHPDVVHLDYVGHAALTERLLDTDLMWSWEPLAFRDGLPAFDANGGLWIKLTVCGVTRLGYGNAAAKQGQDPGAREKEVIGDALRNAGMRFGIALDLWHKGDLRIEEEGPPPPSLEERAIAHLNACAIDKAQFKDAWEKNREGWKKTLDGPAYARVVKVMKDLAAKFPAEEPAPEPAAAEAPSEPEPILLDDEIPF